IFPEGKVGANMDAAQRAELLALSGELASMVEAQLVDQQETLNWVLNTISILIDTSLSSQAAQLGSVTGQLRDLINQAAKVDQAALNSVLANIDAVLESSVAEQQVQ